PLGDPIAHPRVTLRIGGVQAHGDLIALPIDHDLAMKQRLTAAREPPDDPVANRAKGRGLVFSRWETMARAITIHYRSRGSRRGVPRMRTAPKSRISRVAMASTSNRSATAITTASTSPR